MKTSWISLPCIVVALLVLVKQLPTARAAAGSAAPAPQFQQAAQEGKGCAVPKSWGPLKGVADRAMAFEDSTGTIRVVDVGPCMRGETQLIVKITRP
jgi:hypothetical protein